jgi:hypothetical protein
MLKVCWVTLTSGRKNYFKKSRQSWYKLIEGEIEEEIIIDTSGNKEYSKWLADECPNAKIFSLDSNLVIRGNWEKGIKQAYDYFYDIVKTIDCDYILHTEDDYVLLNKIKLEEMINILDLNPNILQVHFIRQPWAPEEKEAGGVLQNCQNMGFEMIEKNNGKNWWVEHRTYFTFGPSIYKKEISLLYKNNYINPEIGFTHDLFSDQHKKTATLGKIDDENIVDHIGLVKG